MEQFNQPINFVVHTCASNGCGVQFALTVGYDDRRRVDGEGFRCPNGHVLSYKGKTRADVLEKDKAALQARLDAALLREKGLTRRLRAAKGQTTKAKRQGAAHG